jgi:hypothetical protein
MSNWGDDWAYVGLNSKFSIKEVPAHRIGIRHVTPTQKLSATKSTKPALNILSRDLRIPNTQASRSKYSGAACRLTTVILSMLVDGSSTAELMRSS